MIPHRLRTTLALFFLVALAGPAQAGEGRMLELVRSVDVPARAPLFATFQDGRVVHEIDGQRIRGVDIETGLVRWEYRGQKIPFRTVVRRDDQLVVIAEDLQLVSLHDGSVLWSFPLGCRADGGCQLTPVHVGERRVVLQGFDATPNSLMVVDLDARGQSWPSWVNVGPIGGVDVDERMILVTAADGRTLTAVDPSIGRLRWKTALPTADRGVVTRRMWSTSAGAHVYRVRPGQSTASQIDTFSLKDGKFVNSVYGAACPREAPLCGALPGDGGALTWDISKTRSGGAGHVTIHDLTRGTTALDDQAYYVAAPLVVAGKLAVTAQRNRAGIRLDAYWLPSGRRAWTRTVPDKGGALRMMAGAGAVTLVQEESGAVLGLSLKDGKVVGFGAVDLQGRALQAVFPAPHGVLVAAQGQLLALRSRPVAEVTASLRGALEAGALERARSLHAVILKMAAELPEAADAHGTMMVHAALRVTNALARGANGVPEMEQLAELTAMTPAGSMAPNMSLAAAVSNLLADWLLAHPELLDGPIAPALAQFSEAWRSRLATLATPLQSADDRTKGRVLGAGLLLLEALGRAGQTDAAWELLQAIDGLPLGLRSAGLPAPARRIVALAAVPLAERAAKASRGRRLDEALSLLGQALALPFADIVIDDADPNRLQIEVLLSGDETPRRREVTTLAKEAARDWSKLTRTLGPTGELECFEACTHRWSACVRPCVDAKACNASNMTCIEGCESRGEPVWPAPACSVPRDQPAFLKCF